MGCDRADEKEQQRRCRDRALREKRASWCRCLEVEMLGGRYALKCKVRMRSYEGADAMKVHYMRMRPHEVQASWMTRTSSSTEGVGALLA